MERKTKGFGSASLGIAVLALVAAGLWTNLIGYSSASSEATYQDARIAYFAGTALCGTLLLAPLRFRPIRLTLPITAAALVAAAVNSTVSTGLVHCPEAELASCLVLGFCHLWFVTAIYLELSRCCSLSSSAAIVGASLACEIVLTRLLGSIDGPSFQWVTGLSLPLVYAVCALFLPPVAAQQVDREKRPSPVNGEALLQVVVAVAAVVVMQALTSPGVWGASEISLDFSLALQTVAGAVLLLLLTWMLFVKQPISEGPLGFGPSFILLITGFFVLAAAPSFGLQDSFLVGVITCAVEGFSHLLLWMLVICAMKTSSRPLFYGGIVGVAHGLFSTLWIVFLADFSGLAASSLFVGTYLVFLLAMRQLQKSAASKADVAPVGMAERLATLADDASLSARETEVFVLLADGKSRTQIAEELFIAESTVKTHVAHIYEKLGVANKNEMFALIVGSPRS